MGKSPGKWIKKVLFGKKSSKSGLSKHAKTEVSSASKTKLEDLDVNPPLIPDPACQTNDRGGQTEEFEKGVSAELQCDAAALLPAKQIEETKTTSRLCLARDVGITRQEQAATKAQTAFRGYLARRAFQALRGIIMLQALVRGHLVRRQAVGTLHCMLAIVKFQAIIRGRRVRLFDIGYKVPRKCSLREFKEAKQVDFLGVTTSFVSEKLTTNAFLRKLLASSPNAMPLSLQYDLAEPNSTWKWLERWSSARIWEPLARTKKIVSKKNHSNLQVAEMEAAKPKRGVRKFPTAKVDNTSLNFAEFDKSKRNLRKGSSHQAESVQEEPQNELERVKHNLRKVAASGAVASDKSEVVTEGPKQSLRKVHYTPDHDVPEKDEENASGKTSEVIVTVNKPAEIETPAKPVVVDEPVDVMRDDQNPSNKPHSLENTGKVEKSLAVKKESSLMENQTSKENQKTRRQSFPSKQEYAANVSQNTVLLPSYMAATESAKAKLRAQGFPKFSEDGAESGFLRRHSLPSSTNRKLNSLSPRMQRQVQANGRAGRKSNQSLSSSRDGKEKLLQPGLR